MVAPNLINFLAYRDPLAAQKLQMQQALAQQLMMDGNKPIDPTRTAAGGVAIPISPLEGLANAGKTVAGAYLQKNAMDKLADSMGGGDGMGTTAPQGTGQKLAASMTGDNQQPTPQEMQLLMLSPEMAAASYKARQDAFYKDKERTNLQKEVTDPASAPYHGKELYITMPDGTQQRVPSSAPSTAPQQAGNTMPNGQPDNVAPPAITNPVAVPDGNPADKPGLDGLLNSPKMDGFDVHNIPAPVVKGKEAQATKEGTDAADIGKTLTVMKSNLPIALDRFEEMRSAAKNASADFGTETEDGSTPWKVLAHDALKDETAKANAKITQTSAQGVLPELGPALAQAGIKGNKFLETLSSNASAIPLHLSPEAKIQNINGLEKQYINNLKATSQQSRKYGDVNAPTDEQINALVAAHKKQPVLQTSPNIIKYDVNGNRM